MWSALYNFWLSSYTEGWERVGVVTLIIWQCFIFQNKSSGGQGLTVIKVQIAMRFVVLKLPSRLVFSCICSLYLFWELLGAFPRGYFQTFLYPLWTPVRTPLDGFYRESTAAQSFDSVWQTVPPMSLHFSQHMCVRLTLVPRGISYWPSGDICTFLKQRRQGKPAIWQLWCSCTCRTAVSRERP